VYCQAEREIEPILTANQRIYNSHIEDFIFGVDVITSLDKVDKNRQKFMDCLYKLSVCRANYRWAIQGMSMTCDLMGLLVTFGSATFSIRAKIRHNPSIAVIGSAISMSNKTIIISSKIARDIGSLESLMRVSVV
jgi:hypothetical protein